MSMSSAKTQLSKAAKILIHQWNQTNEEWDDPVSRRIEEQHINPLLDAIRMAVGAMESMEETISKAQSDSS